MTTKLTFGDFAARLRDFIARATIADRRVPGATFDSRVESCTGEFNELALTLFLLQFDHVAPYRRWCEARGVTPKTISSWRQIPSLPATAFKELDVTSLRADERATVFLSSGTSAQKRSRHFHNAQSLAVYETSLLPWFEHHFLADRDDLVEGQLLGPLDKLPLLALTPPPEAAPNSSLVHMFDTIRCKLGARDSLFSGRVGADGSWTLDMEATLFALRKSMCANRPVALLGTAFNFVHLLDHFEANNIRYHLARGSRVLETGGYKGQSREVPKDELHALVTKRLGIEPEYIVTEYGMSELSSQAYDGVAGEGMGSSRDAQDRGTGDTGRSSARTFRFPPWARVQVISPETNAEVPEGETGLLRIFDLANVRSVMAIQTEDLAVRRGAAFELIGRAAQAEARGCSLMSPNMPEAFDA